MAPHSSILAGRSPGTEEPGRPQPMRSQRVDTTEHLVKSKPYLEHGLQGKYGKSWQHGFTRTQFESQTLTGEYRKEKGGAS